jgi:HD domain-containing protein/pentapeptide repeat protein
MSSGPTQNYDDAALGTWHPHPVLAALVRAVILAAPPLAALALGLAAARWAPATRLGISPWLWLVLEIAPATMVFLGMTRLTRRLLPLSTLLRLTMIFPDKAPSRLAVARRRYSPRTLRDAVDGAAARTEQHEHAELLLELVAAIGAHDELTRGHSERVQAYAALIGTELGLTARDAAKLSWAALLHDIGKVGVPVEILTKPTRPSDAEWEVLSGHPLVGMELAAPLAAWLGPWLDAVGQHHERWDGGGYPRGLAGVEISRAARIVAVADAFDAFTSVRSYKTSLSASAARAELARCSGTQFDPEVVRAFLTVGLGRLRRVAGPASLLAGLPGLASTPLPGAAALAGAGTAIGTSGAALVAAGMIGALLSLSGLAAGTPASAGSAHGGSSGVAASAAASPTSAGPVVVGESSPTAAPTAVSPSTPPAAPGVPAGGRAPIPAPAVPPPDAPAPAPAPAAATRTPCNDARAGSTTLAGASLVGCDLAGVTLTGDYSGVDLTGADLTGATLTNVDLTGAKLDAAKLDRATILSVSFDTAKLTGASFMGATVTGSTFLGAKLAPATLDGAVVSDCTFDPAS